VAAVSAIHECLGWQARHDDLDFIVKTSLAWEHNPRY
jgi:UDP-glucose 4-epimerase